MTNVKCPNETFLNVIFFSFEKVVQKKKEVFYELIIESEQTIVQSISLWKVGFFKTRSKLWKDNNHIIHSTFHAL